MTHELGLFKSRRQPKKRNAAKVVGRDKARQTAEGGLCFCMSMANWRLGLVFGVTTWVGRCFSFFCWLACFLYLKLNSAFTH